MKIRTTKHRKVIKKRFSWQIILIVLALPIAILATQMQQTIRSSAQEILQTPPIFFCLAVGESNKDLCASSTLVADTTLQLNGYALNREKTVYYNDTLTGAATYTNTGDIPVTIKKIALAAESKKAKKRVEFNPSRQNVTVQPGKTVTVSGTSRFFESPDMGGTWEVFSTVTMASGQRFDNPKKTIINVSTACTGLRAIPVTDSDIAVLKNLCSQNPTSKLCKSRQYCELTGGEDCKQPAVQQEYLDKQLQCDEHIVIPEEEQNLLEELCKADPNTDTCKAFCGRTIGSPICPDPNIEVASQVPARNYTAVAGVKILAVVRNSHTGETCKDQSGLLPNGCCKPACAGDPIPPAAPPPAAPPPAAPPPAAPPAGAACQNAPAGKCVSGCENKVGECCLRNTGLTADGLCLGAGQAPAGPPAPGGGGAPPPGGGAPAPATPACKTFSQRENRCCPSTVKNTSDQCCAVNGPLLSTGQCPAKSGASAPPTTRTQPGPKGEPVRTCAYGQVRNSEGYCVAPAQPPAPGSQPGSTGAVCDVNGNNQCPPGNICQSTNGGRSGVCKATNPPPPPPPARHCDASGTTCNVNQPSNCCSGVCVKAAIPFVNTDRCQ